jgi:hypothetical protein
LFRPNRLGRGTRKQKLEQREAELTRELADRYSLPSKR